jgi:hypothetical protein
MDVRNVGLSSVAFVAVVAFTVSTSMAAEEAQSALKKQATVTETQARKSAMAKVPKGTIKSRSGRDWRPTRVAIGNALHSTPYIPEHGQTGPGVQKQEGSQGPPARDRIWQLALMQG